MRNSPMAWFIVGATVLLIAGFMLLGSYVFNPGNSIPEQMTLLQYNREIVEQQQMIINALEQSNKALVEERDKIIEQANSIITSMQDSKTSEALTQ